jgi:hypothetical protein
MWKISSGAVQSILKDNQEHTSHCFKIFALPVLSMHEFLAKSKITLIPIPPYSPHLVLYDFFLFPDLKDDVKSKKI